MVRPHLGAVLIIPSSTNFTSMALYEVLTRLIQKCCTKYQKQVDDSFQALPDAYFGIIISHRMSDNTLVVNAVIPLDIPQDIPQSC